MHTHVRVAAGCAVVAMGLVAGCSSGSDDAAPSAGNAPVVEEKYWPKAIPESGLAKGKELPLEAYMTSYKDTVVFDQAKRALQMKCMDEYGFDVVLPRVGATPPPSDNDADIERRYGITDRSLAEKVGYGVPLDLMDQPRQEEPELTGVQVEVLTGRTKPEPSKPPQGVKEGEPYFHMPDTKPARAEYKGKKLKKGGCTGWAETQLGTARIDLSFVSELNSDSIFQSKDDPAVKAAMKEWSSCMKAKGHGTIANTFDAVDKGLAMEDEKKAIAMAVDDIDCKKETDLFRVWFGIETKIQKKQIADNKAELDKLKSQHDKTMKAIRAHAQS